MREYGAVESVESPAAPHEEERRAAIQRALQLLEAKVGSEAIAKIAAGGGYAIPSKLWDGVCYIVPPDPHQRIRVVQNGAIIERGVTESCLVTTDYSLPWPDVMLQRITAIEADESIIFATGILHPQQPGVLRRLMRWRTKRRSR